MKSFKLGRLPRLRDPRVPHYSALFGGVTLPPPPPSCDYTAGMSGSLGMMLNDQLGDCTCAAVYHALQVWSFNAQGAMETEPDGCVLELYENCCGYNPADPSTDRGGIEQLVLQYLLNTGAPTSTGPHRIAAYVEVDKRNTDDVKHTIADCGVAYIGFDVPAYLMANGPPSIWDVNPSADNDVIGGHAVVLAGYDADYLKLISWGQVYRMTWAFFAAQTEEVYAIADAAWIRATGLSPGGLSLADLEAQMLALR